MKNLMTKIIIALLILAAPLTTYAKKPTADDADSQPVKGKKMIGDLEDLSDQFKAKKSSSANSKPKANDQLDSMSRVFGEERKPTPKASEEAKDHKPGKKTAFDPWHDDDDFKTAKAERELQRAFRQRDPQDGTKPLGYEGRSLAIGAKQPDGSYRAAGPDEISDKAVRNLERDCQRLPGGKMYYSPDKAPSCAFWHKTGTTPEFPVSSGDSTK